MCKSVGTFCADVDVMCWRTRLLCSRLELLEEVIDQVANAVDDEVDLHHVNIEGGREDDVVAFSAFRVSTTRARVDVYVVWTSETCSTVSEGWKRSP